MSSARGLSAPREGSEELDCEVSAHCRSSMARTIARIRSAPRAHLPTPAAFALVSRLGAELKRGDPLMRRQARAHHRVLVGRWPGRPVGAVPTQRRMGVEGFSEVLAKEVVLWIRVTIIEPGGFRTTSRARRRRSPREPRLRLHGRAVAPSSRVQRRPAWRPGARGRRDHQSRRHGRAAASTAAGSDALRAA